MVKMVTIRLKNVIPLKYFLLLIHTLVRDGKILLWERAGGILGWLLLATIILLDTARWIEGGVDDEDVGISDRGVEGDELTDVDVALADGRT